MANENIIIRGKTGDQDLKQESVKPTLIIGVGGSGGDVLLRVRKRFFERYGSLQRFPIVSYLWVDTDSTEKAIPESGVFSDQIAFANHEKLMTTIPDTTKYTGDLNTYPHVKSWFYPGLSKLKTMNEGAGQIRAYSRLGFFDHYSEIRQAITAAAGRVRNVENIEAVREKHNLETNPAELQVFIVFSIAGGTGSGMFLDLAFLVKDLFKGQALTTIGIIMMPGLFNPNEDRVFANGYAAMKELEHYSYEHDFVVQWPDGVKREIPGPPFNYVYLLDRSNKAQQSVDFANREIIFNMIADNIYKDFTKSDFAGYKRGVRVNLDQYMYDKFAFRHRNENGDSIIDQIFITRYGSFGMASITVPSDRIEQACAYKLAADVVDHWGSLSNSGYNAAILTEVVQGQLMLKVGISESNIVVEGQPRSRKDFQNALDDDGRKQGQQMHRLIQQAMAKARGEVESGMHKEKDQGMAQYLRAAMEKELSKLRNDQSDPQQWGDYSRAVYFNKEELVAEAQQRLRGEINIIINDQHQSVGYAIALLRQLVVILRAEDREYIPTFERNRTVAVKKADEAKGQVDQLLSDIVRHEKKWNIPGGQKGAILDADRKRFEKVACDYLGSLLKVQIHTAAIEVCERLIDFIGVAEKNEKGEEINEGFIGELYTLGGQLEQLKKRLLDRYDLYRQPTKSELSLQLYDASDIENNYLPKYLGTGEKARKQIEFIGDQILQELHTSVVDLPKLVRWEGMQNVEARIRDLARVPFREIKKDFDVIEAFWKRYQNEADREREVRFIFDKAKFWLNGGHHPRSFDLQLERHKVIVGIPEQTADPNKLREFESMLKNRIQSQGDPTFSIQKLADRSEIVFYSEVGGIPINWANAVSELRQRYLRKQADGEELHTDSHEIRFEDLVVLNERERMDLEEAHECFLLGLIFGEIWPESDTTGRIRYMWRKKRNIVVKDFALGIEPRALAELISKPQTRQEILKEVKRRLDQVYQDRDSLARFNGLLAWYATDVYPDKKITGADEQEHTEQSNMGRAVTKYLDAVTNFIENQERLGHGTADDFNNLSRQYNKTLDTFTTRLPDGKRALRVEASEPASAEQMPAGAV